MNDLFRTLLLLSTFVAVCVALALRIGGPAVLPMALATGGVLALVLLFGAGPLLLRLYRAQPADETSAPGLVRLMRELAAQAGLPAPRVWIIEERSPSAFATCVAPRGAAVALTTGLLALLTERELRAVLAHELAHIRRRDTRAASLCVTLAGALPLLALAALAVLGGGDDDDEAPAGPQAWLLAALAPLAAAIVLLALDRGREYEADRWAAELCGDPAALADALGKIERAGECLPLRAAERHPQTAALLIVPPGMARGWRRLLASQPSAAGRIQRLRALVAPQV